MKKLIVCCDGTWNTPDQEKDGVPVPTNVARIYNAIAEEDLDGVQQLKYYHPGVGTEGSMFEKIAGGSGGAGLGKNIMSAYKWIATNYESEDQIFLFGFSRGAYTVRSLAGMMGVCGLLNLADEDEKTAWERVEAAYERCYRVDPKKRRSTWSKDWNFHSSTDANGKVGVFFLGVWDTVGALGIPDNLALLNLFDPDGKHNFHDTALGSNVTHARHAVALDELRASFSPTLWTGIEDRKTVEQVWFPGAHSDVGGGYPEKGLSDGALKWMIEAASSNGIGLAFRSKMIKQVRPNYHDVLHNSHRGFFSLLPSLPRSIPLLHESARGDHIHESAWNRFDDPPIEQAIYHPTTRLAPAAEVQRQIYARQPWNETGLFLEAGVEYTFAAEGQWLDRTISCPPSGTGDGKFQPGEIVHVAGSLWGKVEGAFKWLTKNSEADFKGTKREEKMPWFCLVGAIANGGNPDEDGTPIPPETFKIGDGCRYKPTRSGYLYCFANDAWGFYDNNRGSVTLSVKRP